MIYIYMIQFPNWKVYIGQTNNIKTRMRMHKKGNSMLVNKAIAKYGWNNVMITILTRCTEDNVDELERFYISTYNSTEPCCGYNLEGGGKKYKTVSESTREKHRIMATEETRLKISNAQIGNKNKLGKYLSKQELDRRGVVLRDRRKEVIQ